MLLNQTLPSQSIQRVFLCPPALTHFRLKDPAPFSKGRCRAHEICASRPYCGQPPRVVGDCLRCYESLRIKLRPTYQSKIEEVEFKFKANAAESEISVKQLAENSRKLEQQLHELYLGYEEQVRLRTAQLLQGSRCNCQTPCR